MAAPSLDVANTHVRNGGHVGIGDFTSMSGKIEDLFSVRLEQR